jgi:hypothetical protein
VPDATWRPVASSPPSRQSHEGKLWPTHDSTSGSALAPQGTWPPLLPYHAATASSTQCCRAWASSGGDGHRRRDTAIAARRRPLSWTRPRQWSAPGAPGAAALGMAVPPERAQRRHGCAARARASSRLHVPAYATQSAPLQFDRAKGSRRLAMANGSIRGHTVHPLCPQLRHQALGAWWVGLGCMQQLMPPGPRLPGLPHICGAVFKTPLCLAPAVLGQVCVPADRARCCCAAACACVCRATGDVSRACPQPLARNVLDHPSWPRSHIGGAPIAPLRVCARQLGLLDTRPPPMRRKNGVATRCSPYPGAFVSPGLRFYNWPKHERASPWPLGGCSSHHFLQQQA